MCITYVNTLLCKFQTPLKYTIGHRLNKSNINHYTIDDAVIVGDDTSVSKLAHVVATLTGSALM
jgi:hypothetical protein